MQIIVYSQDFTKASNDGIRMSAEQSECSIDYNSNKNQ